jgi:hypothetical protein
MHSKKCNMLVVLSVATIFGPLSAARAGSVNLVTNGGFEQTTNGKASSRQPMATPSWAWAPKP